MAVFEVEAPDGKVYEVEAPDAKAAASVFAPKPKGPTEVPDYPSVFEQFPELNNPGGAAATLGASDMQLGDAYAKALGDKVLRRETVEADGSQYPVMVTRGPDGKEQSGYVNKPGLDSEDIARSVRGALPYMVSGGAAGVAGRGYGLLANALGQGATAAATSVAGDVAQIPLGSHQGVEGGKALGAGMMGFGMPLAARGIGNVAGRIRDWATPQTGAIAGKDPTAVKRIIESLEADPSLNPQSIAQASQKYGPETMLADMGNSLQADAAALARSTGPAKDLAMNALHDRSVHAVQRIADSLDDNMGPGRNLPAYIKQKSKVYNDLARPFYEQFEETAIKPTPELAGILYRAKAAGAYDRALKKMLVKGIDPNTPQNSGKFLDLIKRELDGMAGTAKAQGNRTDFADYSKLAKALRTEVDGILSPRNPAQSAWAKGRGIAGEGLEGREAADLGSKVFTSKKDPYQVEADLQGMSAYGKEMYREGARNDLRGVMGRAASNFGPKGDSAARRALNNDFSRESLERIIAPDKAGKIFDRIDGENAFARTYDLATGNSQTSTMQQAMKRWSPHTESTFASEAGKKGPIGLATEYTFKIADALVGGQIKKAQARTMLDGAQMLTARGRERDRIVNALFRHMVARQKGQLSNQKFERIVRGLLETSRVPANTLMQDRLAQP